MEKINSKQFVKIRSNRGYASKRALHVNFCNWLQEKHNIEKNALPTYKTIQRIEHDNQISKKYLNFFCEFLKIKLTDLQFEKETKKTNNIFEDIDTGLKRVRLMTDNDFARLSSNKKNIFLSKLVKTNLLESRHDEIWNCLSELIKSSSPYEAMISHGNDPTYEINRTNLITKLRTLISSTPCLLYSTSFEYITYWPFPKNIHDDYIKQRRNTEGDICLRDIYMPTTRGDEMYVGDWYLLPVAMQYRVFVLSDAAVESIRFEDEAGSIILEQAIGRGDVAEKNMSEDGYEDFMAYGPLFRRKLNGTYNQVLSRVNDAYSLINYIDSSNIDVILKPDRNPFFDKPFNINDYKDESLKFIDKILSDKNFYKYFSNEKLINFEKFSNKNYHDRLDYLEKNNLKKEFFDGVSSLHSQKGWAHIESDDELLKDILSGKADEVGKWIDLRREKFVNDSAYYEEAEPEYEDYEK